MIESDKPKLSIGMPVYNNEKIIRNSLKKVLSLPFTNFELIISNDGPNEEISNICKEFQLCDKRIRFFQQENNIGSKNNFKFVLDKAYGEYFCWLAQDDEILPGFIEKNIKVLEENKNVVCSSGQVELVGERSEFIKIKKNDSEFIKIYKKILLKFAHVQNIPTNDTYEKNVRLYLKKRGHQHIFYGIYRTKQLKKIIVTEIDHAFDWALIINALNYGNFYVINETLCRRYDGGISSKGLFNYAKVNKLKILDILFLNGKFVLWCYNNLNRKIFLRNLDYFIFTIFEGFFYLSIDISRKILKKIF
jgi:glycosyltransferase involved in cell wall biosynthesis